MERWNESEFVDQINRSHVRAGRQETGKVMASKLKKKKKKEWKASLNLFYALYTDIDNSNTTLWF